MNDWTDYTNESNDTTDPTDCPNCGDDRRETVKRFQTVLECPG